MTLGRRSHIAIALCAAASLAACAGHTTTGAPLVPTQQPTLPLERQVAQPMSVQAPLADSFDLFDAGPPPCRGQQTHSNYASDTEKLLTTGGSLCIPAFGGLGGTIKYPPANPSINMSLISSTTNYTGHLPNLHSGTPIFYLQVATSGATTFGSNVQAGGGLTGAAIKAGKTYTVYGQATISGFVFNLKPCYATATRGRYGGVIGGIGTLLKGLTIPAPASGIIEIYPGKSASAKC